MKKLSIRSLLIVILALVLVFSLVACGDKDDKKPGPTPPTPATNDTANVKNYFNTLWEKSTGIGDEAIGATDDLKVSLGLTVKLDFVDSMDGSVQDSVDVGILLDLVLDRSSGKDKSTNTAIKAKIYDPSAKENWFTAYYFFNDVDNVYIDYAGQHVQIPFSYLNDTYNESFYNFIYNDKPIAGKSVAEIITALTANMGKNWDLNTLVGDVMRVFNINVDGLKDSIGGVFEMLGLSVDEAFDAQGNLNIKNILTNETVAGFFVNDATGSTTANGVTTYTTQLDPEVLGLLDMLGSTLPEGLTDLIDGLELFLEFTTKDNAIDSFTIRAGLPALEGENAEGKDVYPVVAITITDLNFAKATAGEIEKAMDAAKSNYTPNVVLDAAVAIDLKGITLDATAFDKDTYKRFSKVNTAIGGGLENLKLDGTLALTLNGKLDLKDAENNGTVAAAALTYKAAGATSAVDIVKASFKNGNLALTVNQEAKVGDVKIVDALVRLFGDYAYTWIRDTFFKDAPEDASQEDKDKAAASRAELDKFAAKFFSCDLTEELAKGPQDRVITINPDFEGAAWKNFDIVGGFQGLVKKIIDKDKAASAQAAETVKKPVYITLVGDTFKSALKYIDFANNKLAIKTNEGIGTAVAELGGIWDADMKTEANFISSIIAYDHSNILATVSKALTVSGLDAKATLDNKQTEILRKAERKHFREKIFDTITVTEADIQATRKAWNLNIPKDEKDKAKADEEFNATNREKVIKMIKEQKFSKMKAAAIDSALKEASAKATGDNAFELRFVGKTDEEIIKYVGTNFAFLTEAFNSNATVTLDISDANGLELSVKADVNASAGVGVSVKLGAKAYVEADYTDLSANATAGWYVFTITQKA